MQRATVRQLAHAVKVAADLLAAEAVVYWRGARIALPLAAGWLLVLSPDDAGRLRIEAWHGGRVRATMWARVGDDLRLAELVIAAEREVAALVA